MLFPVSFEFLMKSMDHFDNENKIKLSSFWKKKRRWGMKLALDSGRVGLLIKEGER